MVSHTVCVAAWRLGNPYLRYPDTLRVCESRIRSSSRIFDFTQFFVVTQVQISVFFFTFFQFSMKYVFSVANH